MTKLRIAHNLALPLDTATSTLSLLAMKGAGKTHTASVLAEEMLKAKIPIVAIDPTGAWWGLRSSADGQAPGFPVVVMGGEHADVPLDVGAGELVARFLVEERPAGVVLDLSLMRKAEAVRFMTPFIETLYHKNREVLHVFWDECDLHIPQKPFAEQARLLGAAEDLVRRGRIRGLGVTLISQRPAVVNKDVLTQTETLVVLRMTGPQDVKAVEAWVNQHDIEDVAPEMLASLPSLPKGDSWWWSPGALGIFQHTRARERETFDSSRTPKVGERVKPPKVLAPVDLERLRTTMAETIEKAKADDPKVLRAQVAELQRKLQQAIANNQPQSIDKTLLHNAQAHGHREGRQLLANESIPYATAIANELDKLPATPLGDVDTWTNGVRVHVARLVGHLRVALADKAPSAAVSTSPVPARRAAPVVERSRPNATPIADGELPPIGAGEQKILDALNELEAMGIRPATRDQVGIVASYNLAGGAAGGYVGRLTQRGLIAIPSPGQLELTEAGARQAAPASAPITNDEMQRRALAKLNAGERKILEHLITIYPRAQSRTDVGAATNYKLSGGAAGGYVGKLATLNLVESPSPGMLRATDMLFPEGA